MTETRSCQNCKTDFVIEPDDFSFYEKIQVPPPTFCRWCRFIRRMAWRNERSLYKRSCDLCHKNIIAMYSPDVPFPVYCRECWYGDGWDSSTYGRDYDPNRNFFDQYKELSKTVPRLALWQRNVVDSDYSNMIGEVKNVYLSVSVIKNSENVFYSKCVDESKDIVDSHNIISGSDNLYENIEAQANYNSQYLLLSRSCLDSYFLVDCINCSNCFLCYNLRNKKFCIRNKQYTREEYLQEIEKFNLGSRKARLALIQEWKDLNKKAIFRFGNITKCVDVTGNNMLNVKNGKYCFEIYNVENAAYCFRGFDFKDCIDFDFGGWSELMYEYTTGAKDDYNVKFSYSAIDSVRNAEYTESCRNCANIFGCISLHNKEYAILNKTYSQEEFENLRHAIIQQMNTTPFIDQGGRKYAYGEFFPYELSPWAYNETAAQEWEPLTHEVASARLYPWKETDIKNFSVTLEHEGIPDSIGEVSDAVLNDVIGCAHKDCNHQCTRAFRLTDYELTFYRKNNIPVPVLCPNCRYYERLAVMPGNRLYHRKCMNGCGNEFETAYSPERPEMVYCEECYQKEVL